MAKPKRILVAALNWGIGHATRDIPIIDRLLRSGNEVILASDGDALQVWKRTYPQLQTIELPSWNIKYPKKGSFVLKIASRTPYILKAIRKERQLIDRIIKEYHIDGLISDNRFGVYSKKVPSIFITHQVSLLLGKSMTWAEPLLNAFNHYQIKKFDQVWIPDYQDSPNLSGQLSHKHKPNKHTTYIGPISRFMDSWDGTFPAINNDIAIVLSGVEPQRSMLEQTLIEQLKPTNLQVILVQGKSNENKREVMRKGFEIHSFMDSEELIQTFLRSKYIICRSGYSTILDLAVLKQTALMIPTPGQTEQEYLAKWMSEGNLIASQHQDDLDINKAMKDLEHATGFQVEFDQSILDQAIYSFLSEC